MTRIKKIKLIFQTIQHLSVYGMQRQDKKLNPLIKPTKILLLIFKHHYFQIILYLNPTILQSQEYLKHNYFKHKGL
ncbi:unnamed protein product [Paramecium primaurelia]|uniref:Uncharacterized protein n=1 Tax=Paramecium primaurelia TaxID=5886 RepID=A0A8S1QA45_PARPR|nr:unnamed protein product [Paramecium primaurelia]